MEPLFETQTEYTYEKYLAFCNVLQNRIGHVRRLVIRVDILLILMSVIFVCMDEPKISILFLLTAILFPILININIKKRARKAWDSNKAAQGIISRFKFYEDHVEQENSVGTSRLQYDKLYDILEVDSAFYIMIANNQGFIVDKQNCSEELADFIRSKKKNCNK